MPLCQLDDHASSGSITRMPSFFAVARTHCRSREQPQRPWRTPISRPAPENPDPSSNNGTQQRRTEIGETPEEIAGQAKKAVGDSIALGGSEVELLDARRVGIDADGKTELLVVDELME